jgi:hypothetical protein
VGNYVEKRLYSITGIKKGLVQILSNFKFIFMKYMAATNNCPAAMFDITIVHVEHWRRQN